MRQGLAVVRRSSVGNAGGARCDDPGGRGRGENLYVAGEAPPGTLVRIYANDELVGEAAPAADGTWLLEARRTCRSARWSFGPRLSPEPGATASPIVEASVPFMRYPDGVVLEPIATAIERRRCGGALRPRPCLPTPSYVIIRRGDNLWRIARRNYGRGIRYQAIFAANQRRIRNPHRIYPGQVFVIPTRDRSWEAETGIN